MIGITSQIAAAQLTAYLENKLSLEDLVHWAEEAMQEGEFNNSC